MHGREEHENSESLSALEPENPLANPIFHMATRKNKNASVDKRGVVW